MKTFLRVCSLGASLCLLIHAQDIIPSTGTVTGNATNKLDKPGSAGVVTVDGSGNAGVVSGTATDCVRVNGSSGACGTLQSINGQTGAPVMTSPDLDLSGFPTIVINQTSFEGKNWIMRGLTDWATGLPVGGRVRLPEVTVGGLALIPANSVTGQVFVVTNAATPGDCTGGGTGTAVAFCRSNGNIYQSLGGASGTSIAAAPPYLNIGGSMYLPNGYLATIPPQSGWTVATILYASSGLTMTFGANGEMLIKGSGGVSNGTRMAWYKPLSAFGSSSNTVIEAVVHNQTAVSNSTVQSVCGFGLYSSTTGHLLAMTSDVHSSFGSVGVRTYAGSNTNAADIAGNAGAFAVSVPTVMRLSKTATAPTLEYSINGADFVNTNWGGQYTFTGSPWNMTSLANYDSLAIFAGQGNGVMATNCTISSIKTAP